MNFLLLTAEDFTIDEVLLVSLLNFVIILIVLGLLIGVIYLLRYALFGMEKSSLFKGKKK